MRPELTFRTRPQSVSSRRFAALPLLVLAMVTFCPAPLPADQFDTVLDGEYWAEMQQTPPQTPDTRESMFRTAAVMQEEAVRRMLEEARLVWSYMIYGVRFRYVPLDRSRNVSESFEIEPLAMMRPGASNLRVFQTGRTAERFTAILRLFPDSEQLQRLQAWNSTVLLEEGGQGTASIYDGHQNRAAAIADCIKSAVRAAARGLLQSKPRSVEGYAALATVPRIVIASGQYLATARVKINLQTLRAWEQF